MPRSASNDKFCSSTSFFALGLQKSSNICHSLETFWFLGESLKGPMETVFHCAYNLTRRLALSERVVTISSAQSPAQLLAVVLNGPGRDPNAAVWLVQPVGFAEMPRLFAFDIVYLDDQQNVIETAAIGPATPFPSLLDGVASVLFLPDHCLAKSGTVSGDSLKICAGSELLEFPKSSSRAEGVNTNQESSNGFTQPDTGDTFSMQAQPRFSELFSASLIYLPSSGIPQRSEFFLRAEPPRAIEPSGPTQQEAQQGQAESEAHERVEPEPWIAQGSTSEHDAKAGPAKAPSLSPQLPASLRAVLQSVDEQIRREGKGQDDRLPPAKGIHAKESEPAEFSHPKKMEMPAAPAVQQPSSAPSTAHTASPASRPSQEVSRSADDSEIEASKEAFQLRPIGRTESHSQSPAAYNPSVLARSSESSIPPEPFGRIGSTREHGESKPPVPSLPSTDVEPAAIPGAREKLSFGARVQRWLSGESSSLTGNRRRGDRFSVPGLVAFYWTGGAPTPHEIVNISTSGLYLRSKELWSPDTLVRMTLERQDAEWEPPESISVLARVVRRDDGGVGHEFIMTEVLHNLRVRDFLPEHGTNRKELEKFLALH